MASAEATADMEAASKSKEEATASLAAAKASA